MRMVDLKNVADYMGRPLVAAAKLQKGNAGPPKL